MTRHLQPLAKVFGPALRELREHRGVTQDALATSSCLTKAYISDTERGTKVPSLTTILRLAASLHCKATDLVRVFDKTDVPLDLPK